MLFKDLLKLIKKENSIIQIIRNNQHWCYYYISETERLEEFNGLEVVGILPYDGDTLVIMLKD